MLPAIIILVYLFIVAIVGAIALGKSKGSGEDYFLASRSIGEVVFILSLFGTNMTAFAILGSSGMSYQRGIGVYGLMASSSGLVIPLTLFFIGTRLWALGKRFGHMTQVDYLRDRWEMSAIGTLIFIVTAAMLVPYIIIALMGGGQTLYDLSAYKDVAGVTQHFVSYEVGAAVVVFAVGIHIMLGGMRGAAWVNTFQTILFLLFGAIAMVLISKHLGGFTKVMSDLSHNWVAATQPTVGAPAVTATRPAPGVALLLSRERIPFTEFISYMFIPLSSIMFPHMAIMCLSAKKVTAFKKTVVVYPICIMLIWLPAVFLGVVAAHEFVGLKAGESNGVILRLVNSSTTPLVAAFLGAGIMSCVMASDSHQILGLVTMFTRDIFVHYGGKERFGARVQAWTGRIFVAIISVIAYFIALALKDKESIFDLAIRFAFSGFAALAPVMIAALFWKRSNKWGALAATLWVAFTVLGTWWLFEHSAGTLAAFMKTYPKPPLQVQIFPQLGDLLLRTPSNVTIYGYLPVVPMVLGSALLMIVVSLLTPPPSRATIDKYFPPTDAVPQT